MVDCRNCVYCKFVDKYEGYDCLQGLRMMFFNITEVEECSKYLSVIRCKDCKSHEPSIVRGKIWCKNMNRYMKVDGYCSCGERKGNDTL